MMYVTVCHLLIPRHYTRHFPHTARFPLAWSRLPDSRENKNNCVGKAIGGLGRGASHRPKPPLIFHTHFFSLSLLSGSLEQTSFPHTPQLPHSTLHTRPFPHSALHSSTVHRWLSWLSTGLSRGRSRVQLRPDQHSRSLNN